MVLPPDDVLVDRLLGRDPHAFGMLLDAYHGPLCRLAEGFVRDPAVAEEVVQETWMHVVAGLPAFERRSSLRTWIYRILVNRARTRGVSERRTTPISALAGDDPDDAPPVDPERFDVRGMWRRPPAPWRDGEAERLLLDREALARVAQVVETLPEKQRLVITLRDVDGLDAEEVCNLLDLNETHQRVLLHRARARVRAALAAMLGDE